MNYTPACPVCTFVFYKDYFFLFVTENGTKQETQRHTLVIFALTKSDSFKMVLNRFHYLKVLSNILFVLITLLLFRLCHFVLQLDDGSLNLIVLTNERHPAVKTEAETIPSERSKLIEFLEVVFI